MYVYRTATVIDSGGRSDALRDRERVVKGGERISTDSIYILVWLVTPLSILDAYR